MQNYIKKSIFCLALMILSTYSIHAMHHQDNAMGKPSGSNLSTDTRTPRSSNGSGTIHHPTAAHHSRLHPSSDSSGSLAGAPHSLEQQLALALAQHEETKKLLENQRKTRLSETEALRKNITNLQQSNEYLQKTIRQQESTNILSYATIALFAGIFGITIGAGLSSRNQRS